MEARDLSGQSPVKESWDDPGPRLVKFLDERKLLIEAEQRRGPGKPYQQVCDELRAEFGDE